MIMDRITIRHYLGLGSGIVVILLALLILAPKSSDFLKPLLALGVATMLFPFWIDLLRNNSRQREIEEKFLEFVRSLTGNVRSGTPIPKAIKEASETNYASLTPYIKKLSHQIEWGIPFNEALYKFAKSTKNDIIRRSVAIIIEAEKSGGNIEDVMEGVTTSVVQIKKIKDERRANAFPHLIQGYLVFFIFIGIMIVLQLFLLPKLSDVSGDVLTGITFTGDITSMAEGETTQGIAINFETLFISLILIQGFFTGLMIGKFSEGNIKSGVRHSFILALLGYMIFTIAIGVF